jgi:hypothetical protein
MRRTKEQAEARRALEARGKLLGIGATEWAGVGARAPKSDEKLLAQVEKAEADEARSDELEAAIKAKKETPFARPMNAVTKMRLKADSTKDPLFGLDLSRGNSDKRARRLDRSR